MVGDHGGWWEVGELDGEKRETQQERKGDGKMLVLLTV